MTETEQKTSIASTICLNCVFANYTDKVQTGCSANRLELFKKAKQEISEVPLEDKTTFVIEGKTCVYYRNKAWAESYYKTKDTEHILSKIKQELKIPYHAILFFRKNDTLEQLKNKLIQLDQQSVKPKILTILDRSHSVNVVTDQIMELCQQFNFEHWRVQKIQATDQLDNDVIDLAYDSTKNLKYMFYIIFETSQDIPITLSQEIHKSLHDDMKAFTILLPNKNQIGKTVLNIAHKKYAGNSFTVPLEKKILHYDDAPHLIKKVEEICPSLQ
jgi:hypothetical protein